MKSSFPIEDEIDGDVTGDKNNEIDVSLSARFAAHNKIWPKTILHTRTQIKGMHFWTRKADAGTCMQQEVWCVQEKVMNEL